MKKAIWVILGLAIFGTILYYYGLYEESEKGELDQFSTWKKFTPASHLFTALLPSKPQYAKDFVEIPNSDKKRRYDMYASEKVDGTLFLINMVTYPPEVDISSTENILRQNIEDVLHDQLEDRLTVSKTLFQGHKALDFRTENQQFDIAGKAILNDHIIYLLTYTTNKDHFDPEEYQHFIDSFQILKHANEAKQQPEKTQ